MSIRTPKVNSLQRTLELRYRFIRALSLSGVVLTVAFAAALTVTVASIAWRFDVPLVRLSLLAGGAGVVVALLAGAVRRVPMHRVLVDADREYNTKSLLVSAFEFGNERDGASRDPSEHALKELVIGEAERRAQSVSPTRVYPMQMPKMAGTAAALFVALVIGLVLEVSGWFDTVPPPIVQQGIAIEDAGERLADRAEQNSALQQLAEEMQRLGSSLRENQIEGEQARRRIEELSDRIDEEIRNLERTRPLETEEQAELPPRAEDAVRRALERGMSQGEVVEFFTRMRSEGNTIPDVIDALEDATPDRAPDANLGLERDEMDELLDQLNRPAPDPEAESDIVNELEESRQIVEQTGEGLAELSRGDDQQTGSAAESGVSRGGGDEEQAEAQTQAPDESSQPQGSEGQQGGTEAVQDARGDDFTRVEDSSPVFRELDGEVTNESIMDILIRELPAAATAQMTEQDRDVAFERVVEQAMEREQLPPETQRLVRNYFLRITRMNQESEEETHEQSE